MATQPVTKGGETRRRIVDAARIAFAERGYTGTSMNDLIGAAGLTKGGFYFHFESKQELAMEVVESGFREMQQRTLEAAAGYDRASDQVVAMVRELERAKAEGATPAGLDRLCMEMKGEADLARRMHRPSGLWVQTVVELFRRAQAEGDMDPAVDPLEAAIFAVGSYVGLEQMSDTPARSLAISTEAYLRYVMAAVGLRAPLLEQHS